jgi:speckle-type POZ protein
MAAAAGAAAPPAVVGRTARTVVEHEETWRVDGLTPESFTGAAVGLFLHSPPFRACGLDWRLELAPNGSLEANKAFVGAYLVLLTKDATAHARASLEVGGAAVRTLASSCVFSTRGPSPPGASARWGFSKVISHAQLVRDLDDYVTGGVLTVRAVLRLAGAEESASPSDALPGLGADLGALLASGEGADITLVCGEQRLAAHALVLRARSRVFAAQLASGPMCADPDAVPVPPEITPHTLRRLLHFLYTDELEIASPEEATHLLHAADHYDVPCLFAVCERTLSDALTIDNAATTLTLADQQSATALKHAALRFVAAHTLAVMATPGWTYLASARPLLMGEALHTVVAGAPPPARAREGGAGGAGGAGDDAARCVRRRTR